MTIENNRDHAFYDKNRVLLSVLLENTTLPIFYKRLSFKKDHYHFLYSGWFFYHVIKLSLADMMTLIKGKESSSKKTSEVDQTELV